MREPAELFVEDRREREDEEEQDDEPADAHADADAEDTSKLEVRRGAMSDMVGAARSRAGGALGDRQSARALDDRAELGVRRQRAVLEAALAARREAQNASATAAGAWRTSSEPCRHSAIDSTTRRARVSSVAGSANWPSSSPTRASSRALTPCGLSHLGEEDLERARRARQRAQHVEADDVARALPDRRERRLAVQARHARLLDVAGAAEALERLERVVRGALAGPVLADRGRQRA